MLEILQSTPTPPPPAAPIPEKKDRTVGYLAFGLTLYVILLIFQEDAGVLNMPKWKRRRR